MVLILVSVLVGLLVLDRLWSLSRQLWPTPPPSSPDVMDALRDAFVACGLNPENAHGDFDVAQTGKLNEVLHHASARLHQTHPLRTVQDIHDLLTR